MVKRSLLFIGLSTILASGLQANNLINGSFETGDFSGWTVSGSAVVCAGGDSFCGVPFDGTFSATLNGGDVTPDAVIDQTFATTPGTVYRLTFAYGIMDFVGGAAQQLRAEIISSVGGVHDLLDQTVSSPTSVNAGDAVNAAVNYGLFTFTFTADDTSATLQFSDLASNPSGSIDGKLDAVSIDVVPEPSSLLLMLTGIAPLAYWRRKLSLGWPKLNR